MRLAVQFYTLRDFGKNREDLFAALERCAAMGYDSVQFSAVSCLDDGSVRPEEAKEKLDELGLVCVATHRPWDLLRDQTDEQIQYHLALGCDYAGISGLWSGYELSTAGYKAFLREAEPVAKRLADHGIRFGFHNHSHEFIRDPESGRRPYDSLIDAEWLQLLVDTYWIQHAGIDPVAFLRSIPGRIAAVHLKDKEVVAGDGPVMAPVGEGNLDWVGVLDACRAGGTESLIVEQDTCRRDPFDCLRSSHDYVRALL